MEQLETIEEPSEAPDEAIQPEEFVAFVTTGENIAGHMSEGQLTEIGQQVLSDYEIDKDSMSDWLARNEKAIELAKLVKTDKSYPFERAANIKYPLVTTAAMQFNARAYPAICPASDPVKTKVWGADKSGQKAARGLRCSTFMSWQLSVEIEEWESETDKMTMVLPIVGDVFRKWWHDGDRPRCRMIDPGAYIVNQNAQTLALAPRGTEELCYYPFEIRERITSGWFADFEYDTTGEDEQAPHDFIEQSCRLDLDEDGYPEPYVVTVHVETQTVVRLVADFGPDDVDYVTETIQVPMQAMQPGVDPMGRPVSIPVVTMQPQEIKTGVKAIQRASYIVHHQFMPSMDGGLLGTGLGVILGDISSAVNSTFNMLLDAGHYASLGGGFIGSEFRLQGGNQRMSPGEWRNVKTGGSEVRNAMVPINYPGPDSTLFAMLGMLMDAAKDVSSTKDILTGDTGEKNQTATTTLALIEQGMKVFTAVYKRIFRSLKREYALLAGINARYVSPEQYNQLLDEEQPADPRRDFAAADMDIQPVADPESVTRMQEMAKAQLLLEMAGDGLVDKGVAASRILEAAAIPDVDELAPKPNPAQKMMEQLGMKAAEADVSLKLADVQLKLAQVKKAKADAFASVSGAETDAQAQNFDEVMRMLEMQRDDLAQSLAGIGGGMAGPPRNRSPEPVLRGPTGTPQGRPNGGFSLGQANPAGIGIGPG